MHHRVAALALALAIGAGAALVGPAQAQDSIKTHALTLGDKPKYGPDFKHLDYVNPDAPKGGTVRYAGVGSYDSFNPFIVNGDPAGLTGFYETLTTQVDDDSMGEYGLIAESMEVATDNSWIIFNLRPQAHWQDGKPITADDVVFSFDILKEKGAPNYRFYYANVDKAEALDAHRVKFSFSTKNNRELPVIMGQLPVLPKHFWEGKKFDEPSLDVPLGSGPYKLKSFEAGRSVTMERDPNYWGKDLPVNIGTDNYDIVRTDYYRDPTVVLEAFKAGSFDFRAENSAKQWATGYESPALKDGRFKMETIQSDNPQGMQGFAMNLRKPIFQDVLVRQAMILAFDFEWSNKTLFFSQYTRTRSYFQNSPMEAKGLPSPEELKILEPLRGKIPDEVFTTEYNPPATDGSGNNADNLAKAAALLDQAGWKLENGKRMKNGQALEIEFLLQAGDLFERIVQPYAKSLERLGVKLTLRAVDAAQYQKRNEDFDYDMISSVFPQSLSPGNEQRDFWGSASADAPGSRNEIGIKDPVIDQLVEELIATPNREELIAYCRALDRILQWRYYVVPNWHMGAFRIAYWNKFGRPDKLPEPTYGIGLSAWWIDPVKEQALAAKTAPAAAEPGAGAPAGNATATEPATVAAAPADRGSSPLGYLLYAGGAVVLLVIVGAMLKRKKAK
ncbi:extracellular solute-binding protein [Dongia sp.]|uniref:extracellular solute-binding protein n=1 Tax=Dongia sp. TaxID=1977262 RepID=UPI0035B07DDC